MYICVCVSVLYIHTLIYTEPANYVKNDSVSHSFPMAHQFVSRLLTLGAAQGPPEKRSEYIRIRMEPVH